MKKLTLTLGCLLLLAMGSSFASAEEGAKSGPGSPNFGLEGGFNLSSFNGSDPNQIYASRLGFVGGGFLILPFGGGLALQPEILYSQKGGKINGSDYQLAYVEIPILLNVSFVGPLHLILGPSFNANVVTPAGLTVNTTDVGLDLGAQLSLGPFIFSGRYEIGLMDLNSNTQIQNGTFTLLAGFCII